MKEQNQTILNLRESDDLENYIEVTFPSKSENEKLARNIVASILLELNPTVEELSDIKTAVSEAVTNSIVHGYKNSSGEVCLICKLKNDLVYICISDNGVGIENIEKAMQPFFTTGPEGERSGMGFTVMETFMDEVQVENKSGGGLRVELVKKINSAKRGEDARIWVDWCKRNIKSNTKSTVWRNRSKTKIIRWKLPLN